MANKSIFTRLQRLFSTDVIIRNIGGDTLRTVDINKIQTTGEIQTNSLMDRFNRIYTGGPSSIYAQNLAQNYQTQRANLYSEYDIMDTDAIIASALDIIADECTLKNDMGEVLQIRSSDDDIQKILYNLFYDVMNIEFTLWSIIRSTCKQGDYGLKLEIAEKFGVYNVIPYNANYFERQEGYDPKNPASVRFKWLPNGIQSSATSIYPDKSHDNPNDIYFENYEFAHFRLLADTNFLPYGRSYLEPARKLYKQYSLMEDAMLIHRIVRAPEKRIFYVNVGGINPAEVETFMQKTINTMKRTPYVDPQTGEYNLRYNMQNQFEDFYIPIRPGDNNSTKIDTTKGLEYTGIDDVIYLRDKLFAALKVPKAFMGYEKDLSGKATLAAEDIRFARTIERIQRIIVSELYKIALVHLYAQGFRGENLTNFTLSLTNPSLIFEQERIAILKEKVALAKDILESKLLPTDWIYDHVYHMSADEFDEIRDLIREDAKRTFRLNQIENEGNDPAESGESYGTPHDLASLYGKGRYASTNVPDGYAKDEDKGRPEEKASEFGTQDHALGKDPVGADGAKKDDQVAQGLNEASLHLVKNQKLLESLFPKKKMMFTDDKKGSSLLDENQIRE
jgi:hypothetical protein